MADTADLVVLGAWYGTGNKGLYHSLITGATTSSAPQTNFSMSLIDIFLLPTASDPPTCRWHDVRVPDGLLRQGATPVGNGVQGR